MNYGYKNKTITIMGLGLFGGGLGAARFFAQQGAHVTVTDLKEAKDLSHSLAQLERFPISYKLGGHDEEDFIQTDMVIVNPAVPKNSRFIQLAAEHHVPINTEINIFFTLCPAPIIGITGSAGKSTTTFLTGRILQKSSHKTWVGGNIGKSLLMHIEEIKPSDTIVLELSSFQLENLHTTQKSPYISVLTNISPNHLDRHGNMEEYIQAKKNIILHQKNTDYVILNYDDPELRRWEQECKSHVLWYSTKQEIRSGAFIKNDTIKISVHGKIITIPSVSKIKIPGIHNLQNILAASCAAYLRGAEKQHIEQEITTFEGLEHRLEFVCKAHGICYYNDSKATTPESAVAALTSFKTPIILIAGGYDKGSNFEDFAETCIHNCKAVILIGKTAKKIKKLLLMKKKGKNTPLLFISNNLRKSVQQANAVAKPGDVVLLSPACASYDMFQNYEERGREFKHIAQTL